jgi:hypothetical protein
MPTSTPLVEGYQFRGDASNSPQIWCRLLVRSDGTSADTP